MKVIGHQAKDLHKAMVALTYPGQYIEPSKAIALVEVNQRTAIAARR
jgi:hypothetical protein